MAVAPAHTKANRAYQPFGAALTAWKSRRREVLMAGPAGTGKSRALLEKLHYCADKYAGMRGLIVRKTRKSVTQTAMVTFEQKVLPVGYLGKLIHFRTTEQEYRYPNGSIIAVGGLDDPSKVMSSEWDMIYVQEATELTEEDWEALTTRLRNGVMPYQQLIADCNPGAPTHWLKLRCDRGATTMLESRHEDNPFVTAEYLATLDSLTGVRKLRLRYGKWAAAEGMVYEEWDVTVHVLNMHQLQELGIFHQGKLKRSAVKHVYASVDWGFTNPGVILVWAIDGDDRMYLIHEVYQTGKTVEQWWIPEAKRLKEEYGIERFVCDPANPAYIDLFNAHGLRAVGAENAIVPGINLVQARLKPAGDGRPRLFVYENALKKRDETRAQAYKPYSILQEIDSYAWPKEKDGQPVKEVPIKVDDHALDSMRYMALYLGQPHPTGGVLFFFDDTPIDDEPDENLSLFDDDMQEVGRW